MSSSDKILLEDDDNAMFGDGDEEEEEEDVDMAPPPTAITNVKDEGQSTMLTNGDKGEGIASDAAAIADSSSSTLPLLNTDSPLLLSTTLPANSPFPHHNVGPIADRLRNAMNRITADPTRDAEAWQALITEAQSSYRTLLPSLYKLKNTPMAAAAAVDPEAELIGTKLDWVEGCYGALLHNFPYAVSHYVQLVDMFLRLGALTQDEEEQCGTASPAMIAMGTSANLTLTTIDHGVTVTPASIMINADMATSSTERQKMFDAKLDRIFQMCLGVNMDGSPALHGEIQTSQSIDAESVATSIESARTIMGGSCKHAIELWLLFIRKRTWDASRAAAVEIAIPPPPPGYTPGVAQVSVIHQQYEEALRSAYRQRIDFIREKVTQAYETALEVGAGFAQNNHLIWKRYVNFVKSWTEPVNYSAAALSLASWMPQGSPPVLPPADPAHDHSSSQKQLAQLRTIYQRGVTHPMTGLDQFWQEYEAFERSHSDSLGTILVAEWLPKYQHARSIYLERNRVWTVHELKGGRLAVSPVGCNVEGAVAGVSTGVMGTLGGAGAAGVVGAGDDFGGEATGGAGAAGTGKPLSDSEYMAQMDDERVVLSKWRQRAGYERTNPERLSAADHASHVRASYCEEVCAFARHPEVWYEWSQWELLHGGSVAASTASNTNNTSDAQPSNQAGGGTSSAALIAPAKAGDAKSGGNAIRAVAVLSLGMESLPDSALLAQAQAEILERHLGGESKVACIKVLEQFVKRSPTTLGFVLLQRLVRRHQGVDAARSVFSNARRTLQVREEDLSSDNDEGIGVSASTKPDGINKDETNDDGDGEGAILPQNRMVMNRLGASAEGENGNSQKASAGFITWHLYATHATIEHHLSKKPKVAARIYELGLRKHRTFLSTPPYVLHYANLLLELNDEENLRSLLMRAVAACEEEDTISGGSDEAAIARRREMQRPLWDMMLKFESILSSRGSNGNVSADISSIESRRRRALYGPSNEDVVMGGENAPEEEEDRNLGSGTQKNSLNEQLIRVEGYDVASRIANGMARMVDVLTITGAIGNGDSDTSSLDFAAAAAASLTAGGTSSDVWDDECAGGPSDISYIKRLRFQRESHTRAATAMLGGLPGAGQGVGGTAGKLLLSRDRVAAMGQGANAVAVQNAPEWLRPLIALLPPVPKFGRGITKPPPHLIEMALSTLRANELPSRPSNYAANGSNKRRRDDGDTSDEEGNGASGGGYSSQFRSRQRSRLTEHT